MSLVFMLVLLNVNFVMKSYNLPSSPRRENSVCLGLYLYFFNSLITFLTCKNIYSAGRSGIFSHLAV